jgi:SAM-dependent methyltransferase
VVGIDIDASTIAHARAAYATQSNLRFVEGSATALPLADASVGSIVSFETIEHLDAADQPRMIAEFARVLAPGGLLMLSSPNRPEYSDARHYVNPFHRCELDRDELAALLASAFPAQRWFRQRRYLGSALWAEGSVDGCESWSEDAGEVSAARMPDALYFVVAAARDEAALPADGAALSLLCDSAEREWRRIEAQAREVLRLDALLKDRDAALDRQTGHIRHLENLVTERDRAIIERDAQYREFDSTLIAARTDAGSLREANAALEAERARLERATAAQERIIAYRQSARWWVRLPWLRVKLLWNRTFRA